MAWIQDDAQQFTISLIIAPPLEGFLQITNIEFPVEAEEGSTVNIIAYTTNTGGPDYFMSTIDGASTEPFYLESGQSIELGGSFIMPNHDVTMEIKTFHEE